MSNLNFDLLNVLPVTTRVHTAQELAFASIKPLRTITTFHNEIDVVMHVIENDGMDEADSAFEDALNNSAIYRGWQNLMPYLKDVPGIHAFRNKPKHKNDVTLVDAEIVKCGGHLPKGQILYRGGKFKTIDTIINDGPISTSMMPSVAHWHAKKVSGEIAIFEVAEDNKIRAFAFKTRGNQKLKHEYEVLLQNNIRLEYEESRSHHNMNILMFKIYANV
ncbi:MAG: hypothetical protein HGA87_04610 [Desulfobulbaceae bacterium]|nr:hypothetical protein [Desulfobulbaceae bacterium]